MRLYRIAALSKVWVEAEDTGNTLVAILTNGGAALTVNVAQALAAAGVGAKRVQLIGTGLWDDPRIVSNQALDGGCYAAPDGAGYRDSGLIVPISDVFRQLWPIGMKVFAWPSPGGHLNTHNLQVLARF